MLVLIKYSYQNKIGGEEGIMKSKREQELELEVKRLKAENETLKKTLKLQDKQLKQKSELLEDFQKENKTNYYKNKYELALQDKKVMKKQFEKELKVKDDYIAQLSARLNKNSTNSSKPSSTDGFKHVVHNCSKKTSKHVGGQEGHKYHEPKLFSKPDKIVKVSAPRKCDCGGKIIYSKEVIKRQIIDLVIKYYSTEYQGKVGICAKCGKEHYPSFPENLNNKVQYSDSVKGFSMILSEFGNMPVDKIRQVLGILTNSNGPSTGSIMNWKSNSYANMKPVMEDIKEEILTSPVLNNDETPYFLNGKQKYAIGSFTQNCSAIECNGGREKEAFEQMNIFPRYSGIVVGDHYAVNESFQGRVAFCNAHTVRTAKGVLDLRKNSKAKDYIDFIYKVKQEVDSSPQHKLTKKRYSQVEKEYIEMLNEWKKEFDIFMKDRDSKYYDEERKLINLLLKNVEGHLMFVKESLVPFTNNDAERGLRPIKTKMKVIGSFRIQENANGFCNALSIIQTAQKQKLNPCKVLGQIASGQSKVFAFQN